MLRCELFEVLERGGTDFSRRFIALKLRPIITRQLPLVHVRLAETSFSTFSLLHLYEHLSLKVKPRIPRPVSFSDVYAKMLVIEADVTFNSIYSVNFDEEFKYEAFSQLALFNRQVPSPAGPCRQPRLGTWRRQARKTFKQNESIEF